MNRIKIICLCFLVLSFFFLVSLNKKEEVSELSEAYQEAVLQIDSLSIYRYNFEFIMQLMGTRLDDLSGQTEDLQKTKLSDMINDGPILVYRYADINCHVCIESEIETIQKNFIGKEDHILLLCSYRTERDFSIFKKLNKLKFPAFRIPYDALKWSIEKQSNPYCFVLHPDLKVSDVFIPDKSFPVLNDLYLQGIKRLIEK